MTDLEPRARRTAVAVGLAVVIVVAVGLAYLRPWPGAPMRPAPTPVPVVRGSVQQVQFLSAEVGWAVTAVGPSSVLYRTSDAGRHWRRELDGQGLQPWSLQFFDASRGIVLSRGGGGPVLWRTVDGGLHWQRRRLPEPTTVDLVSFADADHGWALQPLTPPSAPIGDRQDVALLRTADGGVTWAPVVRTDGGGPVSGGLGDDGIKTWMRFSDQRDGWIGQTTPGEHAVVYTTTDGGGTWARDELPAPPAGWGAPAGIAVQAPAAAGGRGFPALIVTSVVTAGGAGRLRDAHLFIWQPAAGIWSGAGAGQLTDTPVLPVALGFADARRWWRTEGPSALVTDDAGGQWRLVGRAPTGGDFLGLSVVDARHAWAIALDPMSCDIDGACATALASTVDGGRTWSIVPTPS